MIYYLYQQNDNLFFITTNKSNIGIAFKDNITQLIYLNLTETRKWLYKKELNALLHI